MADYSAVNAAANTGAASTSINSRMESSRSSLADSEQTFLALMTTQLKNQDPLSPVDSNQFTQQIVQMTGVEQQLLTNDLLKARKASLADAAQTFALLNIAMSDAFIAGWATKYSLNVLRPVSYVQLVIDSAWVPALMDTPPFPEYPSGHSVQSSAAAGVLAQMFGDVADHRADHFGVGDEIVQRGLEIFRRLFVVDRKSVV